MYSILEHYLSTNHILMIGMIVTFILTFFLLEHPFSFLPSDQGRAFAVNGSLSKGKLRGVGFIFVLCFLIAHSAEIRDGELFVPFGFVCLSVL